jgi:hypothetical protein
MSSLKKIKKIEKLNKILDNNRANGQKIVHCHGIFDILHIGPRVFAVGSKGFVEHVKSALGALAKGRKAKESGDSYQLREPSAPYQADSLARPRFPETNTF